MAEAEFEVTAWNNGGSGYGFKMSAKDRDALKRDWGNIELYLPGNATPVSINVDKDSLWNETCRELISTKIGGWLLSRGMAPWPKGAPPKLKMVRRSEREFEICP